MSSVCRICFAGNTSLSSVKNNQLLSFYEKLTNAKFNSDDARPRALCCFCYQKLLKCHTFSQMAITSEKLFSSLCERGLEVSHKYITEINMKHHLSVATTHVAITDGNVTAASHVTVKDEPLSCIETQEEVNTEPDGLVDGDATKSPLTLDEDNSEHIHVEQTKTEIKEFICNNCNKKFKTKSNLISHVNRLHSQIKGMEYSTTKKRPRSTCMTEEKVVHNLKNKLVCHDCNITFAYKSSFNRHIRTHTGDKLFICGVCDKRFIRKDHLVYHMRTHTGENTLVCNVCGKQFYQKCTFDSHMRKHTGEKPFACSVCDKQFTWKGQLVKHMRMHTGEKPFACNVCGKQFYENCTLVGHMRIHTGEKPYACRVCNKQFNRKDNVVGHMRIHTGEKPYTCNVCDKEFNRRDNLSSHIKRTHAPLKQPKPASPRGRKRKLPSKRI